ncbi:hypothetical protein Trydic_g6331 [Trypoxylus dichotomus]
MSAESYEENGLQTSVPKSRVEDLAKERSDRRGWVFQFLLDIREEKGDKEDVDNGFNYVNMDDDIPCLICMNCR